MHISWMKSSQDNCAGIFFKSCCWVYMHHKHYTYTMVGWYPEGTVLATYKILHKQYHMHRQKWKTYFQMFQAPIVYRNFQNIYRIQIQNSIWEIKNLYLLLGGSALSTSLFSVHALVAVHCLKYLNMLQLVKKNTTFIIKPIENCDIHMHCSVKMCIERNGENNGMCIYRMKLQGSKLRQNLFYRAFVLHNDKI